MTAVTADIAANEESELLAQEKEQANYRTLPYNIEAEQALIGAVLTNNEALGRVAEIIDADHFFEPVHQRIFAAITSFNDRGLVATPVTLKNHFDKDAALSDIGGAQYLAQLASKAIAVISIVDYAKIIFDMAMRRQLITIGEDIVNDAYEVAIETGGKEQIEQAEQKLFTLASEGAAENGVVALKTSLADAIATADLAHKRDEKISGTPTKFKDLDAMTSGLQNSDLLILAGRPSMGKTAFSVNLALNACKHMMSLPVEEGEKTPSVGFFSLEMSSEQLAARMLAMESGVDSSKMRAGTLSDDEFRKIVEGNKALYNLPFYLDDTPALSIAALRTRARRMKRKHNLSLLIVDYLQLLRGSSKQSEGSRVQEVSEITQGLKAVAKELNIPVIALSQLSRAVEQREDKRPQLSDLRESGSIEQDADLVMFIYREEYYEARREPQEGSPKYAEWQAAMERCMNLTEIIIAKHRNGPIGTAKLFFNSNTTKFEDLAENYDDGY